MKSFKIPWRHWNPLKRLKNFWVEDFIWKFIFFDYSYTLVPKRWHLWITFLSKSFSKRANDILVMEGTFQKVGLWFFWENKISYHFVKRTFMTSRTFYTQIINAYQQLRKFSVSEGSFQTLQLIWNFLLDLWFLKEIFNLLRRFLKC